MPQVAQISHYEPARMDRDRLLKLFSDHGQPRAERMIGRMLEDLAVRLNRAERSWQAGDQAHLSRGARELSDVAMNVGLVSLANAALATSRAAAAGDYAAMGATVARMMRLGEASLMSVWDLRDQSV